MALRMLDESFQTGDIGHKVSKTRVVDFDKSKEVAHDVSMRVFATGPEHRKSPFLEEMIKAVDGAKREIYIDHMYFHPEKELMDALVRAANRGVKIKVITNGFDKKNSPKAHQAFGPRNQWNTRWLYRHVDPENRENIEVYEFAPMQTTLHKKAMVVDRETVFAGSSNMGYKSLETMSDHELNFRAKSKTLAERTIRVFDEDKDHSNRVENPEKIGFFAMVRAAFHRKSAWLIG